MDLHQASLLKKMESHLASAPKVEDPPQYNAADFKYDDMLDDF